MLVRLTVIERDTIHLPHRSQESPSPARKQCPSQYPTGCYDGCQGCKSYWRCSTCGKGYYEGCQCETPLRDERQDTLKSSTAVVSPRLKSDPKSPLVIVRQEHPGYSQLSVNAQIAGVGLQLQALQRQLAEMQQSVDNERRLRIETENKLRGMSDVPSKVCPTRRTRCPLCPRAEGEAEDILDIKIIQVAPPKWTEVRELLEKYQEIKVQECPESTAQVAEDVEGNASSDMREEKRKHRPRHRCLLFTCVAVDPNLMVLEEWEAGSTAALRPSSVGAISDHMPPLARHYLPEYTVLDIWNTGERAFVTDKKSGSTAPIKLSIFPTDQRIYTTSFQPADDKLFPQSRQSDKSTRDLSAALGSKWTKPPTVSVKEEVLQDFTAWGRTTVQGTAMVEQLLWVVKVLAVQQKSQYQSGSIL